MATLPAVAVTGAIVPASWGNDVRTALTENPAYLATAKGDVFIATASGVIVRVAVGTNDYALVAASGETSGVKWGQVSAILKTAGAGHALLPAGPGAATNVTSGAANAYGSYTEFRSASGNAVFLTELHAGQSAAVTYGQHMIGTGGAGSETAVSEIRTMHVGAGGGAAMQFPESRIWPWVPVAASTRIAIKSADATGATGWPLVLAVIDQANVAYG